MCRGPSGGFDIQSGRRAFLRLAFNPERLFDWSLLLRRPRQSPSSSATYPKSAFSLHGESHHFLPIPSTLYAFYAISRVYTDGGMKLDVNRQNRIRLFICISPAALSPNPNRPQMAPRLELDLASLFRIARLSDSPNFRPAPSQTVAQSQKYPASPEMGSLFRQRPPQPNHRRSAKIPAHRPTSLKAQFGSAFSASFQASPARKLTHTSPSASRMILPVHHHRQPPARARIIGLMTAFPRQRPCHYIGSSL
jgi:hypothetical protein